MSSSRRCIFTSTKLLLSPKHVEFKNKKTETFFFVGRFYLMFREEFSCKEKGKTGVSVSVYDCCIVEFTAMMM